MSANYKDLSQSEIVEILKEERVDRELVQECVNRNNDSINHLLNKLAKNQPQISDFYNEIVELPETSAVLYYPNKDSFDFKTLSENVIIHIPENKKRLYQGLDEDQDFYLKIRVEKVRGSLLEYQAIDQSKSFSSFLTKSYIGNAISLTACLSIAVMLGNKVENITHASIPQQHQQISLTPTASLLNDYDGAMNELKKVTHGINVEELTNSDVKMILSLIEDDEDSSDASLPLNKQDVISAISDIVSPYIKEKHKVQKIAESIFEAAQDRKVDYLLFLSIMKVETTTFNQDAISSTGDLSIAQIKPEVWSQEFERLGKDPLDVSRLKKDASYAIDRMGEILEIQTKHKNKDPYWYARYHSKTPTRKLRYAKKVQEEYLKIKTAQVKDVEDKIDRILIALDGAKEPEDIISLNKYIVNYDKINSFKVELTKMKKIIVENKNKKISKMVSSL